MLSVFLTLMFAGFAESLPKSPEELYLRERALTVYRRSDCSDKNAEGSLSESCFYLLAGHPSHFPVDPWIVKGSYIDTRDKDGFTYLSIENNKRFSSVAHKFRRQRDPTSEEEASQQNAESEELDLTSFGPVRWILDLYEDDEVGERKDEKDNSEEGDDAESQVDEGHLHVSDAEVAYFAGYLEGLLAYMEIYQGWSNIKSSNSPIEETLPYMEANFEYLRNETVKRRDSDSYWYQMNIILHQLKGLQDGYESRSMSIDLDIDPLGDIYKLNMVGDTIDLNAYMNNKKSTEMWGNTMDEACAIERSFNESHCSALIVNTGEELYFAHTTWVSYNFMLRTVKQYKLYFSKSPVANLEDSEMVPAHTVHFTGYPGMVNSLDDYYLTSQRLAVMETTLNVQNWCLMHKEYKSNDKVPYFFRVVIANRMSSTIFEWKDTFSKYNSGTYNDEWMVLDYKNYIPGSATVPNGTLLVLEQMPGTITSEDMSYRLNRDVTEGAPKIGGQFSYFAGFNYPMFNTSYQLIVSNPELRSPDDTYELQKRNIIFKREIRNVTDLESVLYLIDFNDIRTGANLSLRMDDYNRKQCIDLQAAIAARMEYRIEVLIEGSSKYPCRNDCFGSTDMKVTNSQMMKNLQMIARNGPSSQNNPAFDWTEVTERSELGYTNPSRCHYLSHLGQPTRFDFKEVVVDFEL